MVFLKMKSLVLLAAIAGISSAVDVSTDKLNLRGGLPDRKLDAKFSQAYGNPTPKPPGAEDFGGKGFQLHATVGGKPESVTCDRNWGPVTGKIEAGVKCSVSGNPTCEQLQKATFLTEEGGDGEDLPKDKQTPCFNNVIKGPKGFKIDKSPHNGDANPFAYSFKNKSSQNGVQCELTGDGNKDTPTLGVIVNGLSSTSIEWRNVVTLFGDGAPEPNKTPKIYAVIIKGGQKALVHFGGEWAGKTINSPKDGNYAYHDISHVEICYDGESGKTTGDPHFKRWDGSHYEFHGGCDLLLLNNPDFNNGQGMHIYARTKIVRWWSYIDQVVVKIGDDVFEVHGKNTRVPDCLQLEPNAIAQNERHLSSSSYSLFSLRWS
ncbi:expressed unknown protein [Seminavis robusta]|uniref:Uncharacterized protein n=1 Tax=Seminavis robusta TaxID=568900 RepID=A0A9N8EJ15_9STRA|nr:expressed unknown protein [Seminavis robusta]|eukprot:Sro1316_g262180.1 n/a (375) ;mRNA; f:28928-30627